MTAPLTIRFPYFKELTGKIITINTWPCQRTTGSRRPLGCAACIIGGEEYTHTILFKQQAGRAIQAYVHQRPWYDYLLAFPPNALPWFVVLPGAIPVIKKLVNAKNRLIWLYVIGFCTVAFYRKRYDNGWNFYLNRAKIPIIRNEDIQHKPPQYDVIILRKKHMNLLKAILNMENYAIGDVVPVGSKRFVLLKYKMKR